MNSTMVTGWAPVVYSTTSSTAPTASATSLYASAWQVQYANAINAAVVGPQWQIIRAPWWSNTWAAVEEWQPAAPAVIRGLFDWRGEERRQEARREAQERLEAALRQTAIRIEEQRQAAAARARELLIGELDPVQRAQFESEGLFIHIGRRGVNYRIHPAVSGNIEVLRRGRVRERLCVHPIGAGGMPVFDTMLAQLLHLRDDEAKLLKIANHHPALAA